MLSSPASLPNDPLYINDHGAAVESLIEPVEARLPAPPASRRLFGNGASGLLPFIPLLAVFLGFLVMTALCTRDRSAVLERDTLGRRLAGEEDDIELPPSPVLEELCASLGIWAPADSSTGDQRGSPRAVEAFFSDLESRGEGVEGTSPESSPQGPRTSPQMVQGFLLDLESEQKGALAQPLASEQPASAGMAAGPSGAPPGFLKKPGDDDSDDEAPGPSWRLPKRYRTAETAAPSSPLVSPAAPPPVSYPASGHSSQWVSVGGVPYVVLSRPLPESFSGTGTAPSSSLSSAAAAVEAAAATAAAAAAAAAVHPFIRVPASAPGTAPRGWLSSTELMSLPTPAARSEALNEIRGLLARPWLDPAALGRLMSATENVAVFARRRFIHSPSPSRPIDAARDWGRRFITLSTLHFALRAVGGPPPFWWGDLVAAITDCDFSLDPQHRFAFSAILAKMLAGALTKYRDGEAPTDEETLKIKKLLFCDPMSPAWFRKREWDAWREDDQRWKQKSA